MNIALPDTANHLKPYTFPDLVTPTRSPPRSPALEHSSNNHEHLNEFPGHKQHYIDSVKTKENQTNGVNGHSEAHADLRKNLKPLPTVNCTVRARIPTTAGYELFLHGYSNSEDSKEHLAIVIGNKIRSKSLDAVRPGETEMDRMMRGAYEGRLTPGRVSSKLKESITAADLENPTSDVPLVRIHSECYTGETIGSSRCDCGDQLNDAASLIAQSGSGVIVYLRQEGRGIGLFEKMKAYNLQDLGSDTLEANLLLHHPADARDYGIATSILLDLGLSRLKLLTNNPLKITAVEGPNREIEVVERVEMLPRSWAGKEGGVAGQEFDKYFATKIQKMGHMIR